MPDAAIEVDGLVVRYGSVSAVDDLHLTARRGEILVLLGVNGAGKTSTMECISGLHRPARGTVTVLGEPAHALARRGPAVGVLLQELGLYPNATPRELVRHAAGLRRAQVDVDEALAEVGLTEGRSRALRRLSGGEQRRVGIAVALVGAPPVVLLDEPTSGLDVLGRRLLRSVLGAHRDKGMCVVLSTHELDEARRIADRLAIVHRGRLQVCDTVDRLTDHGRHDLESVFVSLTGGAG